MLKIPLLRTERGNASQNMLEPAFALHYNSRSYGFRTGRSAQDAQKVLFSNLSSKSNGIEKESLNSIESVSTGLATPP